MVRYVAGASFTAMDGLNPAWISNHTPDKVGWNYLSTSKLQRLNAEVWEWVGSFIPQFIIDVITYPWFENWTTAEN